MMKVDILKKMNRLDDALEVCDSYIESHIDFSLDSVDIWF